MDVNTTIKEISGLWQNHINRRFVIVAIRRLLLSTDRGDSEELPPGEQAPLNEKAPSGEFDPRLSSGETTNVTSLSNHLDLSDISNLNFDADREEFEMQKELQREKERDTKIQPFGMLPPAVQEPAPKNALTENRLEPLAEASGPPFDRLTVFQSAPLAYFDRESGVHKAIPLLDFKHESSIIKESVSQILGGKIEVHIETATIDRFSAYFGERQSHIMHFSCYGHPDHLTLENGYGSLQTLPVDGLTRLMAAVGSNLRVIFISSCYARSIGQAFVDDGVPHVVCCQRDERYRDPVASAFVQNFYQGLSGNKLLKQAFDGAIKSIVSSPLSRNKRRVMDKFHLLPERDDSDHYHSVPVFFAYPVPPMPQKEESVGCHQLPPIPQHFLGRELVMYVILEALRVDDIVKVSGPSGNGKDSIVSAVCDYAMERRKTFSVDDIFWLPAPDGVVPEEDTLFGDLCLCVNILKDSKDDVWDTDDTLLECRDRIEIELEDLQVVLVVDERCFGCKGAQEGMEKFISHLLNVANAKVILITSRSSDACSSLSLSTAGSKIEEANIEIGPLDFKSTAQLFGGISKFISCKGCPTAHSASEFSELLEPTFISNMPDPSVVVSQRRSYLYAQMGNGFPSAVISSAISMSKKDFIDLIGVAYRPEVFVDSLGALEKEIRRRSLQKVKAVKEKNYMRAMDLDIILEELEGMRPEFPTLEDLREEEEIMKADLADSGANRKYDAANDLKRELLTLKKKIMKEQRLVPDQSQDTDERLNEFQSQVHSMIDDADFSNGGGNGNSQTATFAVHCDNRDCSFVVYAGDVYEFEHPEEAMGVVCWSNESCELAGTSEGEKLLEYGGPELQQDISTLPVILKSPYGPVRCGTGNAVIIGPEKYGKLKAPCVLLTVGPLSPTNLEDALEDDTDSLHYIKTMLRSCYRSSLVLAKHTELQALALSLLTTRKTGQAYEQTLRVGLQTLVEEVKFSHLRDLHIMASSSKEASIVIAMMTDMGHRQV
jgi:O-acetyl-ADP-ribose deacetylase (regulator of RNase III)